MGAIVGITAGGAVAFIALIIFCVIRFRRNATWNTSRASKENQVTESFAAEYKPVSTPFSPSGGRSFIYLFTVRHLLGKRPYLGN